MIVGRSEGRSGDTKEFKVKGVAVVLVLGMSIARTQRY